MAVPRGRPSKAKSLKAKLPLYFKRGFSTSLPESSRELASLHQAGLLACSHSLGPLPRKELFPVACGPIVKHTVAGPRRLFTGLPVHLLKFYCIYYFTLYSTKKSIQFIF